jgi:hypothetical protein
MKAACKASQYHHFYRSLSRTEHIELRSRLFVSRRVIGLAISAIVVRASGWLQLTKQFPDRDEQPLICLRGQVGWIGKIGMGRTLTLSACPSGLRVGAGLFFKNIFVPWQGIEVTRGTFLGWQSAMFALVLPLSKPSQFRRTWPMLSLLQHRTDGPRLGFLKKTLRVRENLALRSIEWSRDENL